MMSYLCNSDLVLCLQPCIIGVKEVIETVDALYIVMELWVVWHISLRFYPFVSFRHRVLSRYKDWNVATCNTTIFLMYGAITAEWSSRHCNGIPLFPFPNFPSLSYSGSLTRYQLTNQLVNQFTNRTNSTDHYRHIILSNSQNRCNILKWHKENHHTSSAVLRQLGLIILI